MEADCSWLSFHIAYHTGNLDRLLVDLVRPSVKQLREKGVIEEFFFVRYSFGGPHIRLRMALSSGREADARQILERNAADFFFVHPSASPLPHEEIRRMNRLMRRQGIDEPEDRILVDNALHEIPFEPETERYGGTHLLPHSLAFFSLSSVRVLQLLVDRNVAPIGKWLAVALRLLLRQALGFARNPDELKEAVAFPRSAGRWAPEVIKERADQVFARERGHFESLVREEIVRLEGLLAALDDCEVARRLARELQTVDPVVRKRVVVSQLHMTANRLGLRGVDEAYIARLLIRVLEDIQGRSPDLWDRLRELLESRAAHDSFPGMRLKNLLPEAFVHL